MKKMDELTIRCIASELRSCRDAFDNIADFLDEAVDDETVKGAIPEKEIPTLEQVRAVLADKSRSGKTAKVRELLLSFGAEKLSEIEPARFAEVLKAAEAL